ncbi:PilZ domain-containing protein [Sporosalibacterium faouarense]|uniref:PilZ domain-containing protein n=1 Tax=Sporosalibacterium faouarense TaxID=516123 RepID=UPI00141C1EFE|nr:PilZ domain-containing protein [Sporosalibacterium faouarense]MTI48758.1 PilZ domain-containing protein [Bacillota bacterium]
MLQKFEKNQRSYFRIYFNNPLCATMTIALVNKKPVNTGRTRVCIEDISASGLRFISNMKMPISEGIILDFQTDILDQSKQFSGFIVRRQALKEDIWEYGVQFIAVDKTSSQYLETFNKLSIKIRKNYNIQDCSFCESDNQEECLKFRIRNINK